MLPCAGYVRHPFVSCTFLIDIISGWLGLVWLFIELDATRSRHARPPVSPGALAVGPVLLGH
ncbi:MAG: hypothetical protein M3380_01335 [Chloroflexota bacterium]|nr:hypothetical protein [Chloroflexota bacterium]